MQITEITEVYELVKNSKHSGWCTKYPWNARSYLYTGKVWQFTKPGKRRASYQLWVMDDKKRFEFKGKCNSRVAPEPFESAYPEASKFIMSAACICEFSHITPAISSRQISHVHANNDGTATVTMPDGGVHVICLGPIISENTNHLEMETNERMYSSNMHSPKHQ